MSGLTDKQLHTLTKRLKEEKHELERHFEINGTSVENLTADPGGELSAYDNHPADMATETFERGRDQAIDENFGQKLADVEAALGRIEDGTYGECQVCVKPIPYERLEAIPWTTTCVEHAGMTADVAASSETGPETYEMTAPVLPDEADALETLQEYGSSDSPIHNAREG